MNANPEKTSAAAIRPPRLFQSLTNGFNAVANNIHLILLPVALDLLLWFGPHLRMKALVQPVLTDFMRFMRQSSSLEMRPVLNNLEELWQVFLEQYNLLSLLSTFPVGVPTLMAGRLPIETPAGPPVILEASSFGQVFLGWLAFNAIGLALGTLYFALIAQSCDRQGNKGQGEVECISNLPGQEGAVLTRVPPLRLNILAWQATQVVGLLLVLIGILAVLMVPALLVSSFLALVSPFLAQMALLLVSFGALWFLVPLIFSPHGIFVCGQSVFNAIASSTRVVRYALPGTGLFLLVVIILYQGLGVLWHVPPDTSWMALVGIAGHAFISTGLLAASFMYYRGGLAYVQSLRRRTV